LCTALYRGVLPTVAATSGMYLSLLSVSVTVKKCKRAFSVKIKVLNLKIILSGHF